jgi:hypothetical protein
MRGQLSLEYMEYFTASNGQGQQQEEENHV